ncbi:MAG: very short patch repair endonuclease [Verrucomicrobia bacterium]|nr:very short patch repair endonuclease [Verrucomicrobiota bacterium]
MADTFSPAKRSQIMAAVRSSGNKSTELKFIALLREAGLTGWRRKARVFGNPDFVFRKARVAVFLDGCFWHGCPRHLRLPQTNRAYWERKIQRNMRRDRRITRELRGRGWRVLRFWEHELADRQAVTRRLRAALRSRASAAERERGKPASPAKP